jgi:hypothetical protein
MDNVQNCNTYALKQDCLSEIDVHWARSIHVSRLSPG